MAPRTLFPPRNDLLGDNVFADKREEKVSRNSYAKILLADVDERSASHSLRSHRLREPMPPSIRRGLTYRTSGTSGLLLGCRGGGESSVA
ncbi:MAG: hypothetical protein JWN70_3457 [Planctomycetaceae bacterium]|nr:hypothetical protein [Planctomycetaceae bacterium]